MNGYEIIPVERNYVGHNEVYTCKKTGEDAKILRIAYRNDRSLDEMLAEAEYVKYLFDNGASVSNVLASRTGNLLERITVGDATFYANLFEKAKGKLMVENGYRYREGVPISEYFYNCGKTLGKLHQLSKEYKPNHRRRNFFDRFNIEYINELLPDSLSLLKAKLAKLMKTLEGLSRDSESFGMIHLDFNDGNYFIDFDTGQITVYDFDNAIFGHYMFDLASLWTNGTGWIEGRDDIAERKHFMNEYFATAIAGYRSETNLPASALEHLPLFISAGQMENIVDEFENARYAKEEPECDEEMSYVIKCLEDGIPYKGFFHKIYSCENRFKFEPRDI